MFKNYKIEYIYNPKNLLCTRDVHSAMLHQAQDAIVKYFLRTSKTILNHTLQKRGA